MLTKRFWIFWVAICVHLSPGWAFGNLAVSSTVNVTLIPVAKVYEKKGPVTLLIQMQISPGFHMYWKNPGEVGLSPSFDWHLPKGWSVQSVEWPAPQLFVLDGIRSYGYEGTVLFLATLNTPQEILDGTYPVEVSVDTVSCGSLCIPEKNVAHGDVTLGAQSVADDQGKLLLATALSFMPQKLVGTDIAFAEKSVYMLIPKIPNMRKIIAVQFFPESLEWNETAQKLLYNTEWDKIEVQIPIPGKVTKDMFDTTPFKGVLRIAYQSKQGQSQNIAYEVQRTEKAYEVVPIETMATATPSYVQGLMEPFATKSIWDFILLGLLGGLILNVMPCVLPVIGLKVVHLIGSKRLSYRQSLLSASMYALGIMVAFWVLVALLFGLQRVNEAYGWGFQLQNPYFVSFLIVLFIAISANLFGLFGFGYGLAAWAQEKEEQVKTVQRHIWLQPFLSGLLATCVATPCTGPLLGAVIGFASLLSLPKAALLFTSIAVGMASPFVLIALVPPLSWILPKPGPWMVSFKQCMGFLLLLSTLWLTWVLAQIAPYFRYDIFMLGALSLFFGAWLFGKSQEHREAFVGKVSFLLFLIFFVLGGMITVSSFQIPLRTEMKRLLFGRELTWEPYSEERLFHELEQGHTVLVNGSAKWCLTCQANEIIFANESLKKYILEKGVVLLVADWTKQNAEVTEWLHSLGRNGVPTIAIYKKGQEPVLLPELISPEIVKNGISNSGIKK